MNKNLAETGIVRSRFVSKLSLAQRNEVRTFLEGPGRFMANSDVATVFEKYRLTREMVWYYRRKYNLLLSSKHSFASEKCRQFQKRNLSRLQRGLAKYHEEFKKQRRQDLINRFFDIIRSGTLAPLKTCSKCADIWFENEEFFYTARKRSDGTIRYYNYCKACGLPWE